MLDAFETLRLDVDAHVATLTLDRPAQRNALSSQLDEELRAALDALADDEDVRALVLTGARAGFCAGADLADFERMPTPAQVYDHLTTRYQPLIEALTTIPKPVVAAVNGVAAGAGVGLALACDLRIMADDARLLMAFSQLGLVPDAGTSWLLARQIGYARAFEVLAEGGALDADTCHALGLANRLAPPDELLPRAQAWAARLAQRPTMALGLTKELLHAAATNSLRDSIEHEAQLQRRTIVSDDHREGLDAFRAKRAPSFAGR